MSPKSRGRSTRSKPDRRRQNARQARSELPKPLVEALLAAGDDLLRAEDALEAESIASTLLGIWWGRELIDADADEVFGEAMVDAAARARTRGSLALLTAVAAVADGRLQIKAATAAEDLLATGVGPPAWGGEIGRPTLTRCFRSTDVSGDGSSLLFLFAYRDQAEHCLSVFVDHNLGGIVKDAWATPSGNEVVAEYEKTSNDEPAMTFEAVEPALARALVERAMGRTERALPYEPPISDELRSHRALLRARMRLLPEPAALEQPKRLTDRRLATLVRQFRSSPRAADLDLDDPLVDECADELARYGNQVDEGQPLRVSAVKAEILLTDWLPRFGDLGPTHAALMPDVLRAWFRWSAERIRAPESVLAEALEAVDRYAGQLVSGPDDPIASRAGYLLDDDERFEDVWVRTEILHRRACAVPSLVDQERFLLDPHDEDDRASLLAMIHPEYADALDDDVEEVDGVNPRMHMAMHSIVAEQLWSGDPPQVWETARRLQLGYDDGHEVQHMLAFALAEPLRRSLVENEPFDLGLYVEGLEELPGSWEAARPT